MKYLKCNCCGDEVEEGEEVCIEIEDVYNEDIEKRDYCVVCWDDLKDMWKNFEKSMKDAKKKANKEKEK